MKATRTETIKYTVKSKQDYRGYERGARYERDPFNKIFREFRDIERLAKELDSHYLRSA